MIEKVYSFSDINVIPVLSSIKSKSEISLMSNLTKDIILKIPFVLESSNIDKIMDINLNGGLGIINKMNINIQIDMVKKIKNYINIFNNTPTTVNANVTLLQLKEMFKDNSLEYILVVSNTNNCLGIIKRSHIEISNIKTTDNIYAYQIMTSINNIKYFNQYEYNWMSLIENPIMDVLEYFKIYDDIPILCDNKQILGVLSFKNLVKFYNNKNNYIYDNYGRLLSCVSIGYSINYLENIKKLVEVGLDILCINVENAYNENIYDAIKRIRIEYPNLVLIVGNVNSSCAYKYISGSDVHSIMVGNNTEFGQFTLLQECKKIKDYYNINIPIINKSGLHDDLKSTFKALVGGSNIILVDDTFNWKQNLKDITNQLVSVNVDSINKLHCTSLSFNSKI